MDYLSREAMMFYGVVATLIIAFLNLKNSKSNRYIDSINAERVNWINKIRELFSEFDKVTYLMNDNNYHSKGSENSELLKELIYLNNHIELFLNPTEVITKELIKIQNRISVEVNKASNISPDFYDLHYLQQVVLKSEWKRIKKETKAGKELRKNELRDIHIEIATAIDPVMFEKLLKEPFENEVNSVLD